MTLFIKRHKCGGDIVTETQHKNQIIGGGAGMGTHAAVLIRKIVIIKFVVIIF